ncbi:prolyl oligopeptidase [Bosea sp. OK403]|nr:prolyl oligopeptidase [Bosea sp. OK403]
MDERPTLNNPDDDPRLWLEGVEDPRATAFADRETQRTLADFGDRVFEQDRDALAAIFDRDDRLPLANRRGGLLYNLWQDRDHPRGLWRRTTLNSYRSARPDWELLLDLDALAASESEDWVWQHAAAAPGTSMRVLIGLSRGGSDACVLREFDTAEKAFVEGGFHLPEAKQSASWLDKDSLLVASALGEGQSTSSGYARAIRLWQRGQDIAQAKTVFTVPENHMLAFAWIDRTASPTRVIYGDQRAFFEAEAHLGDAEGPQRPIPIPKDCWWLVRNDHVVIKPRTEWSVAGHNYPADTVLAGQFGDLLANSFKPVVLFKPGLRRTLKGMFWAGDRLFLSILDELVPKFQAYRPTAKGWLRTDPEAMPRHRVVDVWRVDLRAEETNGDVFVSAQDPVTPPSLFYIAEGRPPERLKRASASFDATGLQVSHHEAQALDRERIPYLQIGPRNARGDAPTLMYGYGGFGHAQMPSYNSAVGKLWLERGGTYVLAQIRGGGEFGSPWHHAGIREHKARSHDDFAAVAGDLVERGLTRPGRIAAEGGSNGGLLIANMLTRYPERFGALFCTIPLIDMRRYSKLLAGASWIAEYGDPDLPEDWAFLQHVSAYHALSAGKPRPPILIATTRRDDRVHPGHARKMFAKLRDLGHDAWLYEPVAGGHGYGKDSRERAAFIALGYRFLRQKIGWME